MPLNIAPDRSGVVDLVRKRGAKHVYGPDWPLTDAETLELLLAQKGEDLRNATIPERFADRLARWKK